MIGADTTLHGGTIHTERDLRIDGTVKGDVAVQGKLVLGPEGSVEGHVTAGEMVLCGHVTGRVTVKNKLSIKATAVVNGEVTAPSLAIDDGASGTFTACMGAAATEASKSLSIESATIADAARPFAGDGADEHMMNRVEVSVSTSNGSTRSASPAPSPTDEATAAPRRPANEEDLVSAPENGKSGEVPQSDGEMSYEAGRFW